MKRLIQACSLVGAIALATAAQAQPEHRGQPPEPQERAARLQKTLQLSDEQTAKIKTILEGSAQQRKALMDKYKPQMEALHADGKALREKTESQINAVLTPKQQTAFKAQLERRDEMMRKHMHGHDDDEPPMGPPAE